MRDFRIHISPARSGSWNIRVTEPGAAEILDNEISHLPDIEQLFYNERDVFPYLPSVTDRQMQKDHKKLQKVGATLFDQTFGQGAGFLNGAAGELAGISDSRFWLHLAPAAWELPWELLWHNAFLDSGGVAPIVRCSADDACAPDQIQDLEAPRLLFIGADPVRTIGTRALNQLEALKSRAPRKYSDLLRVICADAGAGIPEYAQLKKALDEHKPAILHIVGHGEDDQGFYLEDAKRQKSLVQYESFFNLLKECKSVKLLIMSICKSGLIFSRPEFTHKLFDQTGVLAYIGMMADIGTQAAVEFTGYLYDKLWAGSDLVFAIGSARNSMRARHTEPTSLEWSTPMLYGNRTVNPFGRWLNQLENHLEASVLTSESIETISRNTSQLNARLADLSELSRRKSNADWEVEIAARDVESALYALRDSTTLINQRYNPENQEWVDSLRAKASHLYPAVERFIERMRNKHFGIHQRSEAAASATAACSDLLRHVVRRDPTTR